MLDTLDTVDWQALPQPQSNGPEAIPSALRTLARVTTEDDSWVAYDRLLYSVGNNHAGTYYPAVLHIIPFLAELFQNATPLVQRRVLDLFIDLNGSFTSDPDHTISVFPDGSVHAVSVLLRASIASTWRELRVLSERSPDPHVRALGDQLSREIEGFSP